jgi:hypothetical protein
MGSVYIFLALNANNISAMRALDFYDSSIAPNKIEDSFSTHRTFDDFLHRHLLSLKIS